MTERPVPAADDELLRGALGLRDGEVVTLLTREPLGDGSVAGFTVGVDAAGSPLVYYVDTSRHAVTAETGVALVRDDGSVDARVWMHPADPHLPALAPAAFGHAAAALLARAGMHGAGAPAIVGYRPGRRAVLRVPTADGDAWIKVVRPRRVQRIVDLHAALSSGGIPVPAVRAWSPEGLVILTAAAGAPAIEADLDPDVLLDAVDRLREALAGIALACPARTSLVQRIDWYAGRIRRVAPERADRIAALLHAAFAAEAERPAVGIHGDLHAGQLFLEGAEIVGVIDVDTAGRGDPADDAGAFTAHAVATTLMSWGMPGEARMRRLAQRALARWATDAATRARIGAQLLGHAVAAADAGEPERMNTLLTIAEDVVTGREEPFGRW